MGAAFLNYISYLWSEREGTTGPSFSHSALTKCARTLNKEQVWATVPAAGRARGQDKPHGKCGDVMGSCASVSAGELRTAWHACPAVKTTQLSLGHTAADGCACLLTEEGSEMEGVSWQ